MVGGSKSQLPYIQAARNLGFSTVVIDRDPAAPGARFAQQFFQASTHDFSAIEQICRSLQRTGVLQALMTSSAAPAVLTSVARLTEDFGLPGFSLDCLQVILDKQLQKQCLTDAGVRTPHGCAVDSLAAAKKFFQLRSRPLMIKPAVGSQGSLGVSRADKEADLDELYTLAVGHSRNGQVLLEDYYQGREFSIDGIVVNGRPTILAISEKFNLGAEQNFIISGFAFGPDSSEDELSLSALETEALAAVAALGIDNSLFSVDLLLTDIAPLVLEVGVLLDAKIDRLLHFAGVEIYQLTCQVAAGMDPQIKPPNYPRGAALKFLFAD